MIFLADLCGPFWRLPVPGGSSFPFLRTRGKSGTEQRMGVGCNDSSQKQYFDGLIKTNVNSRPAVSCVSPPQSDSKPVGACQQRHPPPKPVPSSDTYTPPPTHQPLQEEIVLAAAGLVATTSGWLPCEWPSTQKKRRGWLKYKLPVQT